MNIQFPYKEIRPEQKKFLDTVKDTEKKYVVAQMPTGSGKSGIAIYEALLSHSAYIVVANKALQDQYWRDFKDRFQIKMLKGMQNYDCEVADVKCDQGPCQGVDATSQGIKRYCKASHSCPYYNALEQAFAAPLFLANTNVVSSSIAPKEAKRELMIIDEAHLLEDFLVDLGSFSFSYDILTKKFNADKYLSKSDLEFIKNVELESTADPSNKTLKFVELGIGCVKSIYREMAEYESGQKTQINEAKVKNAMEKKESVDKKFKHRRSIIDYINKISCYELLEVGKEWVFNWDKKERRLDIVPIKVDWIFRKFFGSLADRFIFMSATILNFSNFVTTLGISEDDCCFVDVKSTFDPEKAPIVNLGNCNTNYKDLQDRKNMDNIVNTCRLILSKHKGMRGIIHTGNMKISKYIKENLHDSRLLVRLDEVKNEDILAIHNTKTDSVLVSSSMTEGIDLHDDLSQFQIIVKLPWDSLGNLRTKTMADRVPLWYSNKMWQKLLQASGRSIRSNTDEAETFILDSSFGFQHKKFRDYLPEYFEDRIVSQ